MFLALAILAAGASKAASDPAAPKLRYVFSIYAELDPPIEQGVVDGRRKRFVPISGGAVSGPRLQGVVLAGGGDWQSIGGDGLTVVDTRYTLKTSDGVVIDIANPGVRVASPEVTAKLAAGEQVAPDAYYFRTSPRFSVGPGPYDWLRRTVFVGRGVRNPDNVQIDVFAVE
ncbi:MAG TPA: DUF3237 domain-containing protein [Caulobacteraceae bacterium]|nr:DUF3237 domain-containing protein [Caulobacteraceae bacterium]